MGKLQNGLLKFLLALYAFINIYFLFNNKHASMASCMILSTKHLINMNIHRFANMLGDIAKTIIFSWKMQGHTNHDHNA